MEDPEFLAQRPDNDRAGDPAKEAAIRDDVAAVQQAVAQLPEEYRTVVVLRYLEDMSCEDVAATMDIPVGTVKTWLFRAREMLRDRMKARENPIEFRRNE